jgi:hypothetical protein
MTNTKFYSTLMFKYGLLAVLYALEYFEEQENYEECHKIIQAIEYQEKRLDTTCEKRVTKKAVLGTIEAHKKWDSKEVIESYKRYGKEVVKAVNEQYYLSNLNAKSA